MVSKNPELHDSPERRLKPRFRCNYPAWIQGYDENGEVFEEIGKAVNLSRSGVYLLLNREIPEGMDLTIRISIPTENPKLGTSKLAVRGKVVRGEFQSETIFGIAVKFQEYRFV
jgi:hypothetical protein